MRAKVMSKSGCFDEKSCVVRNGKWRRPKWVPAVFMLLGFPGQRVPSLLDGDRQIADGDAGYVVDIADLVEKVGLLHDGFAALPPGPVAAADFLGGAVGEGHAEVAVAGHGSRNCLEAGGLGRPVHGVDRVGDGRAEWGYCELIHDSVDGRSR